MPFDASNCDQEQSQVGNGRFAAAMHISHQPAMHLLSSRLPSNTTCPPLASHPITHPPVCARRLKLHQQARRLDDSAVGRHLPRLSPHCHVTVDLTDVDVLAGAKDAAAAKLDAAGWQRAGQQKERGVG